MNKSGYYCKNDSTRSRLCTLACAFIAVLLLAAALPAPAQAHPPKSITLSYDAQKKLLTVAITHPSFFPSKHYIKSVEISVNGKNVKSSSYSNQPSSEPITYTYQVDAATGDEISVVATCNMFGTADASIKVTGK
jgi:desulfoferrodoxin (superoxide reductase-like protein)